MSIYSLQDWKIFDRCPNAKAIATGLKDIPAHWSLTPLQDKSPRRENWQNEPFIPHSTIAELILHGEQKVSKKGKTYTAYWSGFGVRTGEASGGLLAIDVDGTSAQPLLDAISGGDIPLTPSWTSGKEGRYQLVFQIPDEVREQLKDFNRAVLSEWGELQTARDAEDKPTELLEFRYNRSQSCLPPSRHPTTGAYYWSNNPADVPVAQAPQWLCELLLKLASQVKVESEEKQKLDRERFEQRRVGLQNYRKTEGSTNLIDFLEFSVLPKLSAEQIYNWEGHNFRYVGKTMKGAPPWRASASGTSFHVWWDGEQWAWQDKALGDGGRAIQYRWKLRGGFGTPQGKDFVDVVAELAGDAGLQLPAGISHEPDSELYAECIAQQEEEERVARSQHLERQRGLFDQRQERSFKQWFGNQVSKRLKRLSNWIKTREGQGEDATPIPSSNPFQGRLITPADIPAPEVYRNEGAPLYLYRSGDMERIWQAARFKRGERHYKAVLDVSLTGTGKSEIAGRQRTENWFFQSSTEEDNTSQKLLYFSQSGQNTTAPSLENWTPLARMHNGLVERLDKLTGGGKPFVERPRPGETPTIPGNCWATSLQHLLAQKNIGHGGSQAEKDGDSNPICNLCGVRDNCKDGSPGARPSGFKSEMKAALAQPRLKGTLAGFPGSEEFQIVAFVDEAEATIQATRDVTASVADIDKEFFRLWQYDKDLYDAFAFIQSTLSIYLSEEKPHKYGYDFSTIKSWFAEKHLDGFEFELAIRKLEAAANALSARELGMLRSDQSEDDVNTLVTLNWLIPFCRVVSGTQSGSARIVNNQLIVTVQNDRELDLIRSFDFTVLLDATADRDEIARILGYEPWEIFWVMQVPPSNPYANLRVAQVIGLGGCGKQRRDRTSRRIEATEQAIEDWALGKTPNPTLDALVGGREKVFPNGVDPEKIAYIRHLKYYNAGELYYFGGNNGERGSNAAQDCQLLIMEGLPRENIGSALARYHALYGTDCNSDHPDFKAWYNRQIDKRIFQAIGRSRYTRRANQIIPILILGDADLSGVVNHYGVTIQQINAFHVAAEAGTPTQVNGWKIFQALKELRQEGSKVLQRRVVELTQLGQSTISEFASLLGGWKSLIQISETLLKGLYSTSDISELPELTDVERAILEQYLPLFIHRPPEEVLEEFGEIIRIYGLESFSRIVCAAPLHIQARMMAMIMLGFPTAAINELTATVEGIP